MGPGGFEGRIRELWGYQVLGTHTYHCPLSIVFKMLFVFFFFFSLFGLILE